MRILIAVLLSAFVISAKADTITATTDGNWVQPQTWSNHRIPVAGDTVVIPYNIDVAISRPLSINTITIVIAGTLDITNGLLQMSEGGKITIQPGGKMIANGLGATIIVGLVTHVLESGALIEGPATIDTVMVPRRRRNSPSGS
jgi:sporulation-control protein spo0M